MWLVAAAVALVVGLAFAVLVRDVISLRTDVGAERRATRARAAADAVEIALLNLQTGSRGYILTGDSRFLRSWSVGRQALRPATEELVALATSSSAEAAAARQIATRSASYLEVWSSPLVQLARRDRPAAEERLATRRGEQRVDRLRTLLTSLDAAASSVSANRKRETRSEMETAIAAGGAALLGSVLLVFFWAFYVDRLVLRPVRAVGAAAERLGRGDLSARVPARGIGEVAELESAFNRMAVELEQASGLREAVFDSVVDGICVTDLEGKILSSNARLDALVEELAIPRHGTVFERLAAMADRVTDPDAYRATMARIARTRGETSDEFTLTGTGRSFRGFTGPVNDSTGTMVGRIFTLRETTAERESERLKDEFVANVSHELRTPLTVILGYLDLALDDDRLNDAQRSHLQVANRNAERLLRLVGDLLFVTQVDAGAFRLELEPVDPVALAGQTVEAFRPLAEQKNVRLVLDAGASELVEADPLRIAQLLDNLVSNALKFTSAGGQVVVRARAREGSVELAVADTGVGIAPADHERLFQRFERAEEAQRKALPGTGLGLAIVRAIAHAHGGEATVVSEPGLGSTFIVHMPLQRATQAA